MKIDYPKMAFPSEFPLGSGGTYHDNGMTLRDYFATNVDIGDVDLGTIENACEFLGVDKPNPDSVVEMMEFGAKLVAKIRYMSADAMLKAREASDD